MQSLADWVRSLSGATIPVLRKSVEDLRKLRGREDSVTARDLSGVVLRDPLLTLKVLRFSQSRLTQRQPTEVTTVEHALMMHGMTSFFKEMRDLVALEDQLARHPAALDGALRVISRAWHAACSARTFAEVRHDTDAAEVVTGALLHDLAELLLWCTTPAHVIQIQYMLQHQRGLRSAMAQRACLGFAFGELQLALAREWKLPSLLQSLMDDQKATQPRVRTVALSVALARHSANGWYDLALPDDYAALQKLLNVPAEGVLRWVRVSALQAATSWRHTGIRPASAWLPLLPGEWPEEEGAASAKNGAAASDRDEAVTRALEQLKLVRRGAVDVSAVVALAFYALGQGAGLRRIWLGSINAVNQRLEAKQTLLLDPGLLPGELSCKLDSSYLFARMLKKMQGVWCAPATRDKLAPLLPEELRVKLARRDFFAMSLHVKGQPFGLLYADGGSVQAQLSEPSYTAFKNICQAFAEALERLSWE